jgi:uncharacterized protein YbjT (DUF2867 family)
MKILLTGATGYVGQRLLPVLLEDGHEVVCCVRDLKRVDLSPYIGKKISLISVDLLNNDSLLNIPADIDVAYYLVHSMAATGDFESMEQKAAAAFKRRLEQTSVQQVIYLSGITNQQKLSKHLSSRRHTEEELKSSRYGLTILRAGIILGSGSASFEIIRDLVEKLPIMIAPAWLHTRSTPIAIANVIDFMTGVLKRISSYNQCYDIYGPDILTYKEMLLKFAAVRHLSRTIFVLPIMTARLSSYWLYFVTSVSYRLAQNLVDSMKVEVIPNTNHLAAELGIHLIDYPTAIQKAFDKIEQHMVISTWKDALNLSPISKGLQSYIEVPVNGCYKDARTLQAEDRELALARIFSIGGDTGWYYGNWLWEIRGFIDKLFGGVGLKRGRKNADHIKTGETLDFWRVIYANFEERRLLLYAEMRLPGEAWLEFTVSADGQVSQVATFRPLGLWGRLYWYTVLPFHGFIFKGMLKYIAAPASSQHTSV